MTQRIEGILFDLGETVLDFGDVDTTAVFKISAQQAYAYLKDLGKPLPPFKRFHRRQLWSIRWHYLLGRLTGREFSALDLLQRLGRRMGYSLTDKEALDVCWLWYEPLSRPATAEDGLHDMLSQFREMGLTLGVVSNTFIPGAVLDRHLEEEGLLEYFEPRIYSSEVGYRKPRPEIFDFAIKQTGLDPARMLFVGDTIRADIRGANRAGMVSVLKDPANRYAKRRTGAAHRIRSITELARIVEERNGE